MHAWDLRFDAVERGSITSAGGDATAAHAGLLIERRGRERERERDRQTEKERERERERQRE
jgi:hypothetical protein